MVVVTGPAVVVTLAAVVVAGAAVVVAGALVVVAGATVVGGGGGGGGGGQPGANVIKHFSPLFRNSLNKLGRLSLACFSSIV